jgi:uncharacterized protein YegP (UPF0339 family)
VKNKELLRVKIAETFNEADIESLCFDLSVDKEELKDDTKSTLIINLINYFERRGQIQRLVDKLSELRPHIHWPKIVENEQLAEEVGKNKLLDFEQSDTNVVLSEEMKQIQFQIEQGETWLGMSQLRNLIALKLQKIARLQDISIRDVPPMHLLHKLEEQNLLESEVAIQLESGLSISSAAIQGIEISKKEAMEAFESAVVGLHLLERAERHEARFEITQNKSGRYIFVFKDSSGQEILNSDEFVTKRSTEVSIHVLKKNIQDDNRIRSFQGKDSNYYFRIIAANGQVVGISKSYNSLASLDASLEVVKKSVEDAPIVDLVDDSP